MRIKTWLIIATALVIVGILLFAGVMTACRWDFTQLGTVEFETNTYEFRESVSNISVNADTADILFAASKDEMCRVECYEMEHATHSVAIQNGILTIELVDSMQWHERIGINIGTPKITIYLPEAAYTSLSIEESTGDIAIPECFTFEAIDIAVSTGDVKNYASATGMIRIRTSTGDIEMKHVSADTLALTVSTGKVKLTDIRCADLTTSGSTGDMTLKNVTATERISIHRSTGDIFLDRCDAADIYIKTDTGSVTGTLLTDKVFVANTDTGKVTVPNTVSGGRCEIITNTGDIKLSIA